VAPENRTAYASDTTIEKLHPITGKAFLSYRVLGDKNFRVDGNVLPTLAPADWKRVLCTGRCTRTGNTACKKVMKHSPLDKMCLAECLQLHPQAAVLSPAAIAQVLK
jgi:hypothetical protein